MYELKHKTSPSRGWQTFSWEEPNSKYLDILSYMIFPATPLNSAKIGGISHAKSLQLCPTLCDPMDHRLLGSSVYGILQARILDNSNI